MDVSISRVLRDMAAMPLVAVFFGMILGISGSGFPSSGCGNPNGGTNSLFTAGAPSTILVNDNNCSARSYVLYVPESVAKRNTDANSPVALFVVMHGFTSSPKIVLSDSKFNVVANNMSFVVAYPQGIDSGPGSGWAFPGCNSIPNIGTIDDCGRRATCTQGFTSGCVESTCPSASAYEANSQCGSEFVANYTCQSTTSNCNWCGCSDDEGFLRNVVSHIEGMLCIDRTKIYLTGMSQGGMYTSYLSSRMADVFAGFAPVSGLSARDFAALPDPALMQQHQMPWMLWLQGTRDRVIPFDGSVGADSYYYESIVDETSEFADLYNCATHAVYNAELTRAGDAYTFGVAMPITNFSCYEYPGCNAGLRVAFCLWDGNHVWPTMGTYAFGSTVQALFMLNHSHGNVSTNEGTIPSCSSAATVQNSSSHTFLIVITVFSAVAVVAGIGHVALRRHPGVLRRLQGGGEYHSVGATDIALDTFSSEQTEDPDQEDSVADQTEEKPIEGS
eukprot:m.600469 g.600469  ORF g.600469 m.600469 type:complete len:503 (-) comp22433_c0_seq1:1810-3318(-)